MIHTCALRHLFEYATSVTLVLTVDDVSYVVLLVSSILIIPSPPYLYRLLGISDAYYCAECTRLEKDRDGCPKIVNLGASRTDLFYERRRLGEWSIASPTSVSNYYPLRIQKGIAHCAIPGFLTMSHTMDTALSAVSRHVALILHSEAILFIVSYI